MLPTPDFFLNINQREKSLSNFDKLVLIIRSYQPTNLVTYIKLNICMHVSRCMQTMAAGGAIDLTATWGVCVSRTISVVCIVCITILLSLYYMATEDARYLALPSANSAKFYADGNSFNFFQ